MEGVDGKHGHWGVSPSPQADSSLHGGTLRHISLSRSPAEAMLQTESSPHVPTGKNVGSILYFPSSGAGTGCGLHHHNHWNFSWAWQPSDLEWRRVLI